MGATQLSSIDPRATQSSTTVLVAFASNLLVAIAKSIAAVVTGSASLLAEAAHSWADTGNEIFLVVAGRRARRPPDQAHPLGVGREAYVWSLFAALGLFVAGAAVSVTRGIQELIAPRPATNFAVGYAVIAFSFLIEGISLLRSTRQASAEAESLRRDLLEHVLATSDPTLRAVFAEDVVALAGLGVAAAALAAHQITGSATPDAVGSIVVGLLLAFVAIGLINSNRRFLVGKEVDPRVRAAALQSLLADPDVARVTYLRLEIVGPRMVSLIGDVDLTGDDTETHVALRLRALEARLSRSPAIVGALLSLSAPDEPTLSASLRSPRSRRTSECRRASRRSRARDRRMDAEWTSGTSAETHTATANTPLLGRPIRSGGRFVDVAAPNCRRTR